MHGLIALATATGWVRGERDADFRVDLDAARAGDRRAPPVARLPVLAEQPDRHRAGAATRSARSTTRPSVGGMVDRRRGLRRVSPGGRAERRHAAARVPAARRHPHDEQGVRAGRRPGRLPRRGAGSRRRPAAGPAALPPVVAHPGGRPGRAAFTRGAAGRASRRLREQRDRLLRELPALGCPVVPSDANFVLFQVPGDQHTVWQALLDHGVLVRDVGLRRLAAGDGRHRLRRWTRSCRRSGA